MDSSKLFLLLLLMFTTTVYSFDYQVGGAKGWIVPPSNDTTLYNEWASQNRFLVGDSVRFRYKKDSVMEVSEEGYKSCNSSHPKYFSNSGNTVYELDHSGPYYFISGTARHCDKGQKMIIKVMGHEDGDNGNSSSEIPPSHGGEGGGHSKSAAVGVAIPPSVMALALATSLAAFIYY
ncbi:Early nodulin-like protein 1 [Linum perenne]